MEITVTKISKVAVLFEMDNGNWTIVMVQTEKEVQPTSFRLCRSFGTEEWQIMHILKYANAERSDQLVGKDIKVVLDKASKVVGYGSMEEDTFFLLQNEEIKSYNEKELREMEARGDRLLTKTIKKTKWKYL